MSLLQVWHLLLPVDGRALGFLLALSGLGWYASRRSLTRGERTPVFGLAALACAALWLADRAIGPAHAYDSANYHLPLIRWFNRFPIVPGLANLSPVYGVNLSGLLVPAALETGPGLGRSSHFVNGFLVFLLLLLLVRMLSRRTAGGAPTASQLAAVCFLYPTITFLYRGDGTWISSPATDVPVTVVVFAACTLAFEAYGVRRESGGGDPQLFMALALLAVTPCLKTTAAVFAAAAWFALAGAWALRQRPRPRRLAGAILFATLAIGPWLVRSAVLSGYPLYPSSFAALDADWRLPLEHVEGVVWWTRAYTRTPEAWDLMVSQEGASWLPYWLNTELRTALHEVLVPAALSVFWLVLWLARGRPGQEPRPPLLLPLAVAIPAWFLLAPATRYGLFLFWALCAQAAAAYLAPALKELPRPRAALAALALFSVLAPLALHAYYTVKYRGDVPLLATLRHELWTDPGPDHGFHPLYKPLLDRVTVCRDLDVYVPAARAAVRSAAPWPDTLPWDGPLPATALLYDGLCLRRPGDLEGGFRTEPRGLSWPARNASAVAAVRRRTGWGLGRLAVYFCVRPELIRESLRRAAP
ncbi:MAG TPA: hypothetical protein VMW27_01040 [Thermoanaerobaculia bacterium]|nr:hypothetical protein [Thermoanaerobaculia bacterium]